MIRRVEGTAQVDAESQQTSPVCGKCGGRTTFAARVPDFSRKEQLCFYRCEMCRLITSTSTATRPTDAALSCESPQA
jgi:hypothetical protein